MTLAAPLDSLTLTAVFHALPGAYLLLSPDFIIEEVSNTYLAETLTERHQLLGRYLFEVFPDNPQALEAHAVHNLRASLEQVLATKQPHQMALQHYDVPNPEQPGQFTERYWLPANTPIVDAEGRVRHLLHSVVNVTDQQRAHAQLGESQRRERAAQTEANHLVRATIDSSLAIIQAFEAVRDAAGRIVDFRWTLVNKQAAAQYNTDPVGQRLLALNPGVVEAGIFARFVQVVESGQPQAYEQEYRHEQYNGWFEQSVVRLGDGVVSTTTDITTRKQAEAALRHSEERFRALVTQAAVGIAETEEERFTYVNDRFCTITGYSRAELLGKLVRDITHPDDAARDLPLLRHLYATGEPFTVDKRYVRPDGSPVWTLASVTSLQCAPGHPNRGFAACIDVTDRKWAEQELLAAHARTIDILESTTDAFYALDAEFRFTYVNQRAARLWGRSPAALLGRHYWTEFPSAVGSESYKYHYQVQQEGRPRQYETVSPLLGTWIDVNIYPGPQGGLSVFFRDITERKRTEQALRHSQERLQQALSIETVGVLFFDLEGRIHDANEAFQRLSGYSHEEFVSGKVRWDEVTPPEFMAVTRASQRELLTHGKNTPYEKQYVRPDGSRWWGLFAGKRLSDRECVEFVVDITEFKQAQHQLHDFNRQLQRMNTDLDNFIYTASHDLKAPIANIEGLLQALQHELPAQAYVGSVSTILHLMQESTARFGRTIGHLTDISRLQKEFDQPVTPVSLTRVVAEVQSDLAPLLAQTGAQVAVAVPEHVTLTFSEKNLRSVVYNLLSNALKYRHPDRVPRVRLSYQDQGPYQVLSVQDNGLGLDLSQGKEKLFAMFQRLHTHVEGSGVGLYMIKRMVENIGGRIEVHSQLDQGSTFLVYFPQGPVFQEAAVADQGCQARP
ncbi:PAS domain S-box protein [Hymenobacter wooponensis]|nr:PAS domain S-box protein [Hymenobacter wooponensis]